MRGCPCRQAGKLLQRLQHWCVHRKIATVAATLVRAPSRLMFQLKCVCPKTCMSGRRAVRRAASGSEPAELQKELKGHKGSKHKTNFALR